MPEESGSVNGFCFVISELAHSPLLYFSDERKSAKAKRIFNQQNKTMMTKENLLSQTITFLRFPLIIGVVLIHSKLDSVVIANVNLLETVHAPVYGFVSTLFSEIFARIAVPLFYFVSGFLFFYKMRSFTGHVYMRKLKKRLRTLLIPYVFWNLAVIAFYFFSQSFMPGLMSGNTKLVSEFSLSDWLYCFWDRSKISPGNDTFPICYQLWFIRDLMVVVLFSPLIYMAVRKLRQLAVLCLGVCWIAGLGLPWSGFSTTAFFFFAAGSYFSIHNRNFVTEWMPLLPIVSGLYVLLVASLFCCGEDLYPYLHSISILVGGVSIVVLSARLIERGTWRPNAFLSDSSFFIYAYHAMPLAFVVKLLVSTMKPQSDGMILMLYFLCPMITVFIGLIVYYLLKRYLPAFTSFITGGR